MADRRHQAVTGFLVSMDIEKTFDSLLMTIVFFYFRPENV